MTAVTVLSFSTQEVLNGTVTTAPCVAHVNMSSSYCVVNLVLISRGTS